MHSEIIHLMHVLTASYASDAILPALSLAALPVPVAWSEASLALPVTYSIEFGEPQAALIIHHSAMSAKIGGATHDEILRHHYLWMEQLTES